MRHATRFFSGLTAGSLLLLLPLASSGSDDADQKQPKAGRTQVKKSTVAPKADKSAVKADKPASKDDAQVPEMNLLDAMRDGLVGVKAEGTGDGRMTLSLTNKSKRQLRIVLPPGIIAQGATGQFGGMGGMGGGGMGGGGMGGGGMGGGGMGGGMGGGGGGMGGMGGMGRSAGTMPPSMGMMMLARMIMYFCGDRLDVMVQDAQTGERQVREALQAAGIPLTSLHAAPPTLENVFVATLRALHPESANSQPKTSALESNPQARGARSGSDSPVAIGAQRLIKTFGDFQAVKDVNLGIRYGEIYGLLGANGAGKTTTIKMLCGLLAPTSGSVTLAGETGSARSPAVRQRVGYMSQKFSLYDDLSIDQNLDFFAGIYGVPTSFRARKKQWILEFAGLIGRGKMLTGELPGGWKQRVAFGAAIMHEPSVLFLDEPTSGVDPIARRAFWEVINDLADQGVAILVTTHYLEEAEQCNRLGMMVAGELVTEGTPTSVKAAQTGHLFNLRTDRPQAASNYLKTRLDRWRVSLFGDQLHVILEQPAETGIPELKRLLAEQGIAMLDAEEQTYSMEDVFIAVVEKSREQGRVAAEE